MISSTQNKRVVRAARLKKRSIREKDRTFLIEGAQTVGEALASGASLLDVFYTPSAQPKLQDALLRAERRGVPVHRVSEDVMHHLTSTVTPQGVVAVGAYLDQPLTGVGPEAGFVPVLLEARDPGNAGTILRSADAAGAGAVVFTLSSVDVYNPKTVRATAGSLFHVPVVRKVGGEEAVEALRGRGFTILAASPEGDSSVYEADLSGPTAVLFGNEARGLAGEAARLADGSVRVPIAGRAESLNLAAAATVILFEWARQHSEEGSLAQIVAGAAHDIRSPLTALRGFVSTLSGKWGLIDESQRAAMLDAMAHDASRMSLMVAQLVDGARIASRRLELSPTRVDLLEAALRVREEVAPWAGLDVEVSGEEALAWADPARVKTMLHAVIEAAAWFGESGPVAVEVSSGSMARVTAWRAGSTVGPGTVENLFRPRAPGTGGSGKVALFVARGLCRAHGGSLEAEAGEAIRFTMSLPAAPSR